MSSTSQSPISCTGRDHEDWSRRSLETEADPENIDRDPEYLPMDVFIDARTRREHFCIERDPKERSSCSLEVESALENLDRKAGREYVPMDVFVDLETIREHFQDSSVRTRWISIHRVAA